MDTTNRSETVANKRTLSLPGYLTLPNELKPEVLKHYSIELRKADFASSTDLQHVQDILQAFTHHSDLQETCFDPTALDLVRLHFAREAKVFPLAWFRRHNVRYPAQVQMGDVDMCDYRVWNAISDGPDVHWAARCLELTKRGDKDQSDGFWWLHYLACIAYRVDRVVASLEVQWCPRQEEYVHPALLHFLRYLDHHDLSDHPCPWPATRADYFFSLPKATQTMIEDLVDHLAGLYTQHSRYDCPWPLGAVGTYYQDLVGNMLLLKWTQFVRCGAFKAALTHYFCGLHPSELVAFFVRQYERRDQEYDFDNDESDDSIVLPEHDNPKLFLTVVLDGNDVILRPRDPWVPDKSRAEFYDENRAWALWWDGLGSNKRRPGDMIFDKNDVRCGFWMPDGLGFISDTELADFFASDY